MSKLKLIILILVKLKSRNLAAEMRRKKVIKMIICKRKLFKHKILLLCATAMQNALFLTIVEKINQFTQVRGL